MKKRERIIASFLLGIISLSNILTPVAYAAPLVKFHAKKPLVNFQNASLAPESSVVQPDQGSVLGTSTSLLSDGTVPLTLDGEGGDSANIRIAPRMEELQKKVYETDEDVMVSVINPDEEPFSTTVTDDKKQQVSIPVTEENDGSTTSVDLSPSDSLRPGEYTVAIKDSEGQVTTQDFTWGVLAMNFDKSEYHPGESADISFGVLNDNGDMVCDADLTLKVTNSALGVDDTISTTPAATSSAQIAVSPQCQSHDFSLEPDYYAHYKFGDVGTYQLQLTASTNGQSHTIADSIQVTNNIPFDVQRVSATRIYPPNTYPMLFNITANRDFSGTVTETVPDSFTITPATQSAVAAEGGTGGTVSSYDNMQTVYLNNNDPAANLHEAIIASDSGGLVMPFVGSYPITQGFGAELTDPSLQAFYTQFGLAGHDGVDFGVPMFTPLYAVDSGTVIWSGPGDYGVTIIIKHGWGESYYGHLSSTVAKVGQAVSKGELIGYSGESGDATGPHLHFGMRPNNPDMTNGYYGKIDPLPYLPFGHEPQSLAALLPSSASQTAGQQLLSSGVVLGASDSGGVQAVSQAPTLTSQPTLQPSATASTSSSALTATPASGSAVPTPTIGSGASTPQPSLEQTDNATPAANESFSVLDKDIQLDEALSASTQTEKVKVITWQVSLKKGQQITLGYDYQAPRVSPEFYLLGPMKFYEGGSNKVVFQEQRAWEIAADDVGTEWFYNPTANQPWNGYGWQHRKKIDISHLQVGLPGVDSQSFANQSGNVHILNWTHTVGNYPNRLLVVTLSTCGSFVNNIGSITYGGQSLTQLKDIYGGGAGDIEMWYLVNPNVGTNTIAITLGIANTCIDGQAISLYNVNQTNPFGTPSAVTNTAANFTNTVTTTANQLVLDTMWTGNGSSDNFVPGTGQEAIWTGSAFGIGSYKASSGTSTNMSWSFSSDVYADIAVGINPEMGTAISPIAQSYTPTFMDSGGDANNTNNGTFILAANNGGFYDGDSGSPTVDCTVSETGPCSYKFTATSGGAEAALSKNNILADSGSRISMYFNYATLPTTGGSDKDALVAIFTNNDSTFIADLVNVTNAGKLCINNTTTCSTDTIVANNWYHLSVSYTLKSTTIQSVNVYLNGKLEVSEANAQTWGAKGSQALAFGSLDTGASSDNVVLHIDDIYVDNGNDLSDPGNIHVTAKLPISNGATDSFTPGVEGTPTGYATGATGNAQYVSERPLNTGAYLESGTDSQSENFTLQSASQGDVNITNDAIVGDYAWAYISSNATCSSGTADITNNGINATITLPTTNAMIATASAMTTYPSGSAAIGLESCSAGTNRTINYYETGLQIAYTPAAKSNVTFIDSGGDASENTTNELGFWTGNNFSTGTGATSVDCTTSETGPCSIELNSGTGSTALDTGNGAMATSSGRISFYFETNAIPTGANILHPFNFYTGTTFDTAPMELNASGNLECGNGLEPFGTTVISPNTWYRISVGYIISGTTITYNMYINGNLELACPAEAMQGMYPNNFGFGSDVASTIVHIDDVYADNGADMGDTGNIHVTAKRPYTNGTTNQFTTHGSASTYGAGNAAYVNERPINTTDYVSGTHGQTDEYSIEGASQGDVNISTAYPIASQVWVDAELAATGTCSTPAIINNGTTTPIELSSSSSYSIFSSIYTTSSYPSGNTDVGMTGCSGSSDVGVNLAEEGMQIAYETTDPNSLTNFPVLINIASDNNLKLSDVQNGGADILFTDSTGENLLPFELESFTHSSGSLQAWVNIASLSLDNDSIIYMYYGNPAATSLSSAANTWNHNYEGVWHMQQNPGTTTAQTVTEDQTGFNHGTGLVTTLTWNQTVSTTCANPILIVGTSTDSATNANTNVTYDNGYLNFTKLTTKTGTNTEAELWYLESPPTGLTSTGNANQIVVTFPSGSRDEVGGSVSFCNVNQFNPLGTAVTANGTASPITLNLTGTSTTQQLFAVASGNGGTATFTPTGTSLWNNDTNAGGLGQYTAGTGGTVAMKWTYTGSTDWAEIGVPINGGNSSVILDSTANANNASPYGTVTQDTSGEIGDGITFDGSTGYALVASDPGFNPGSAAFSGTTWVYDTTTTGGQSMFEHISTADDETGWEMYLNAVGGTQDPGYISFWDGANDVGVNAGLAANTWEDVGYVRTGTVLSMYMNGVMVGQVPVQTTIPATQSPEEMAGDDGGDGALLNGSLDEMEYSDVALPGGWIKTAYNNQSAPTSFYTLETTDETDAYAPTLSQMLRHGQFFGTQGSESGVMQPFTW